MKTAKLGAMFLISILALAGIGMGYASWTDTITIEGTVNTGTVDLVVEDYSGTWVWKVYGVGAPTNEIVIFHGFVDDKPDVANDYPDCTVELISSAVATQTVVEGVVVDDAVTITFDNLFPCIDFQADILFHYDGSIPVKISNVVIDISQGDSELVAMWALGEATKDEPVRTGAWIDWYWSDAAGTQGEHIPDPTQLGLQLHKCNYILVVGHIHLPQQSILMDKSSSFTATFEVTQWNEYP